MGLGLIRILEAHVIHDGHQMHIDGGNGEYLLLHEQGRFCDAQALTVVALEIGVMGLDIEGEHLKTRGQETKILL